MLSQVHARTRDCEQRGVRRARTAVSAEGPKRRSKEFWVLSLPVLPGYRSGALANLREEAPSHTASLGRGPPLSPPGPRNQRGMIIYSKQQKKRRRRAFGFCESRTAAIPFQIALASAFAPRLQRWGKDLAPRKIWLYNPVASVAVSQHPVLRNIIALL